MRRVTHTPLSLKLQPFPFISIPNQSSTIKLSPEGIKCPNRFTSVCWHTHTHTHTVYYFIWTPLWQNPRTHTHRAPAADAGERKGRPRRSHSGSSLPVSCQITSALKTIVQTRQYHQREEAQVLPLCLRLWDSACPTGTSLLPQRRITQWTTKGLWRIKPSGPAESCHLQSRACILMWIRKKTCFIVIKSPNRLLFVMCFNDY